MKIHLIVELTNTSNRRKKRSINRRKKVKDTPIDTLSVVGFTGEPLQEEKDITTIKEVGNALWFLQVVLDQLNRLEGWSRLITDSLLCGLRTRKWETSWTSPFLSVVEKAPIQDRCFFVSYYEWLLEILICFRSTIRLGVQKSGTINRIGKKLTVVLYRLEAKAVADWVRTECNGYDLVTRQPAPQRHRI